MNRIQVGLAIFGSAVALALSGCGVVTPTPVVPSGAATPTPRATAPLPVGTATNSGGAMPDSGTPPPLPTTGATIAASTPTEASPESPTASAQSPATSPEGVVQAFYNWYLGYKGNPLATRAYRTSPYLTSDFVQRIDNALISLKPGIPADPFICAQNPPTSITAGTASISGDRATVVVQAHYSGSSAPNNLPVSLVRVNGQWKIDDVKCPTNPGQLSPVGTP